MQVGDEVEVADRGARLADQPGGASDEAERLDRRPRPLLPLADRIAARRAGPHRALQLGVRAPPRRHLRLPDRGHRQGAQHRGVLRRAARARCSWLGLDWDEGPEVGGPHAPYRQSERGDLYARRAGAAPRSRRTPTTATAPTRRSTPAARRPAPRCRATTASAASSPTTRSRRSRPSGRQPVVRFRMPDGVDHLGRPGPRRDHLRDPVRPRLRALPGQRRAALHAGQPGRRRADGDHPRAARRGPAVVDAAADRALRRARSSSASRRPRRGSDTCRTSWARATRSSPSATPRRTCSATASDGFLPEGLLNYLALLGWAIAADRDVFTLAEMVEAFDIGDVNPNPARFDLKKAEAINAAHMRMLPIEEITAPGAAVPQGGRRRRRPGLRLRTRSCSSWRCRWSPSGSTSSPRPPTCSASCSSTRRRSTLIDELDDAGRDVVRAAYDALSGALESWSTAASRPPCGGADREARAQAAGGVRAGPDRGHRPEGVAPAVRVAGAARPRPLAGAPVRGSRLMDSPNYHLIHRIVGRWAVWRPIVGVIVFVAVMVLAQFALLVGFIVVYFATGADIGDKVDALSDTAHVTPSQLAYLNLSLAAAIPAALLLTRVLHSMRPGWLSSVVGRLRWRWMALCSGWRSWRCWPRWSSAPSSRRRRPGGLSGGLNDWTDTVRDFVIVIVLLTPLQAAGEEYAFRGYLTQAFGGLFRQPGGGGSAPRRALRAGPRRPGRTDLRRPARLRHRRRDPRHRDRRPRGRHRDARAQQLPGLRLRAGVQRHDHRAQPDRRQLVDAAQPPSPSRWSTWRWRSGRPAGWASRGRSTADRPGTFWRAPNAACKVSPRPGAGGKPPSQPGRTPVRQWDMV